MNEPTRRGLLASAALLFGVGAGCQQLTSDGGPGASSGTDEGFADVTASDIYVERTVGDLPSVAASAFGITGEGLFRSDGDGWTPVQYGSADVPVPSVNAVSATVGADPTGRPLISNGDRTIYVDPDGGDDAGDGTEDDPLATIQEALRRVPIYLRHQYVIDLVAAAETPVTYDEDVLVPTVVGTGRAGLEEEASELGPFLNLIIRGRDGEPGAVRLGSVTFGNVVGTSAANLFYATITRNSPYDDERTGLVAYGTGEVHIYGVDFTDGPRNGLLAYGAKMKASVVDVGENNVNIGVRGKRHASIIADRVTGDTRSTGFMATSNSKIGIKEGRSLTGNPTFDTRVGGLIHDYEDGSWYGAGGGPASADGTTDAATVQTASDGLADGDPGEIYYVDGSSDLKEGFYGRTSAGPVRLDRSTSQPRFRQ
jgi:hypothetical protein